MEEIAFSTKSSHLSKQIDLNNWMEIDIWSKLFKCSIEKIIEAATITDGSFKEVSNFVCKEFNN